MKYISPFMWQEVRDFTNTHTLQTFVPELHLSQVLLTCTQKSAHGSQHYIHSCCSIYHKLENFLITYFVVIYYLRFQEAVNIHCSKNSSKLNFWFFNFRNFFQPRIIKNCKKFFWITILQKYTPLHTIYCYMFEH